MSGQRCCLRRIESGSWSPEPGAWQLSRLLSVALLGVALLRWQPMRDGIGPGFFCQQPWQSSRGQNWMSFGFWMLSLMFPRAIAVVRDLGILGFWACCLAFLLASCNRKKAIWLVKVDMERYQDDNGGEWGGCERGSGSSRT